MLRERDGLVCATRRNLPVAGALLFVALVQGGPSYAEEHRIFSEKTYVQWLEVLQLPDAEQRGLAIRGLCMIGEPGTRGVVEILENDDSDKRFYAALAIEGLGPQARAAMPALEGLMGRECDGRVLYGAARALCAMGDDGFAVLDRVIASGRPLARHQAAVGLVNAGKEESVHAIPVMRDWLRDQRPEARNAALVWVKELGVQAKPLLPELIDVLGDNHGPVRAMAALAVGAIGPEAAEAVQRLKEMLKDRELGCRYTAGIALIRIDARQDEAVSFVLEMLAHRRDELSRLYPEVVEDAFSAFATVPRGTKKVTEGLMKLVKEPKNVGYPPRIVVAMMRMGVLGEQDSTILLESCGEFYRLAAEVAAGKVSNDRAAQCIRYVLSGDRTDCELGQAGLALLGEAAIPGLLVALRDKDASVRLKTVSALEAIGPMATSTLLLALGDENPAVRQSVAFSLKGIAPDSEAAVEALRRAIADREHNVGEAAVRALGAILRKHPHLMAKMVHEARL